MLALPSLKAHYERTYLLIEIRCWAHKAQRGAADAAPNGQLRPRHAYLSGAACGRSQPQSTRAPTYRSSRQTSRGPPYAIDGAMDGPSFLAYVEQVLAPTLHQGDIVFIDNLRTP